MDTSSSSYEGLGHALSSFDASGMLHDPVPFRAFSRCLLSASEVRLQLRPQAQRSRPGVWEG